MAKTRQIEKVDITWKNTLNPSFIIHGWKGAFLNRAVELGYPYYVWSGRVYHTLTGEDTGIFEKDLV